VEDNTQARSPGRQPAPGITADTSLRLAHHFGTSADFRINIQNDYELTLARKKLQKAIEKQVRPRKSAA
jgi:plasmid maintenance system antidote protein VapI